MCRKIKTTVLFMRPASWSTDISSIYYSDINLILFDYAWHSLCNNGCSSSRATPGVSLSRGLTLRKSIVAVITEAEVLDDNLKRQIKIRTCILIGKSY